MREIKFKAWDKEKKKIFQVGMIQNPMNGTRQTVFGIDGEEIKLCCLMQYTGLKDKNDKEDWISDLVKVKIGNVYYIREIYQHINGSFCIDVPTFDNTAPEAPILLYFIEHENIGNIYENPELLKEC